MEDNTRILLDIQRQVGHLSGTMESVKALGEKTHEQAVRTNGRVNAIEAEVDKLLKRPTPKPAMPVTIESPEQVNVKSATINKYLDNALIVGTVIGGVLLGIIELFR